ncbi:MAG: hypothetical protein APF81_23230 [Desulfosporosinus sp. BRH_c37]|nr:MAG: hypothetical protein APF81_23230 [Desulfosporosinus sp. BRH_c37]
MTSLSLNDPVSVARAISFLLLPGGIVLSYVITAVISPFCKFNFEVRVHGADCSMNSFTVSYNLKVYTGEHIETSASA